MGLVRATRTGGRVKAVYDSLSDINNMSDVLLQQQQQPWTHRANFVVSC